MVATENRHLWNRLSRLTKTNKSLGSHLNKITDALQQHPPTQPLEALSYSFKNDFNFSKNDSDQLLSTLDPGSFLFLNLFSYKAHCLSFFSKYLSIHFDFLVSEHSEASLEEISLKLINNIRLEKSELEQQYAEVKSSQI